MGSYAFNTPIVGGKVTLWFRMLLALYESHVPLHKKDWFDAAGVQYSDEAPVDSGRWKNSKKWPYRHWRGLYPDMFSRFRGRGWVEYDRETYTWKLCLVKFLKLVDSLNDPEIHALVFKSWFGSLSEEEIDQAFGTMECRKISKNFFLKDGVSVGGCIKVDRTVGDTSRAG